MILEVQICTYGMDGLARVASMNLPALKDITYTVCLQNPEKIQYEAPSELQREDIRIIEHASRGLSNNRNYALSRAVGDILLIADDDLAYNEEGLKAVLDVFRRNTSLDFATFAHHGGDLKAFPANEFDMCGKHPKGYYVTSFEIALRRDSLPSTLRFSPLLGVGAPMFGASEESVFVRRLIKNGLKGIFFPIDIVEHRGVTTGNRRSTVSSLRAQGLWLWMAYGWCGGFARLVRDVPRRNAPPLYAFRWLADGFFKAHRYFNRDGSEKIRQ